MTCPKCGHMAKETNVEGRESLTTRRRYVCKPCKIVLITHERIAIQAMFRPKLHYTGIKPAK